VHGKPKLTLTKQVKDDLLACSWFVYKSCQNRQTTPTTPPIPLTPTAIENIHLPLTLHNKKHYLMLEK